MRTEPERSRRGIVRAIRRQFGKDREDEDQAGSPQDGSRDRPIRDANTKLARHGLRIVELSARPPAQTLGFELAIAANHRGLREAFKNTRWGGEAGKTAVYTPALRRLPGASVPENSLSIGGENMRVTKLPLTGTGAVLDLGL
jgi:hypothetical protein